MTTPADAIDRREALRRVALLLGGTLSAPAIAGVLAGCSQGESATRAWKPRAFSAEQGELVATVADRILPATDTPGARDVGVHRFIDIMMAEYYSPDDRRRVLEGLRDLDTRAQRAHGRSFVRCTAAEQLALLTALDVDAFPPAPVPQADASETERGGTGSPAATQTRSEPSPARREPHWFRTMKELTLLGYYTSEPGATKELRYVQVPGRFDPCVPLSSDTRTWAV